MDGLEFLTDSGDSSEMLFYSYLGCFIEAITIVYWRDSYTRLFKDNKIFELTLWVILILGVRKLWQDMRRNINNVFRNIQYSMLITLCTVDIIQGFMRFEPRYLLGTYAINVYACYLYQWAEFINISCWINFIIQMNVYHDPHQFKLEMIQKTRNKEKWFMVFYAFAMVLYLVPAVVMHIMMYIASCENCDPFDDVFCKFHSPPLSPCTLKTK